MRLYLNIIPHNPKDPLELVDTLRKTIERDHINRNKSVTEIAAKLKAAENNNAALKQKFQTELLAEQEIRRTLNEKLKSVDGMPKKIPRLKISHTAGSWHQVQTHNPNPQSSNVVTQSTSSSLYPAQTNTSRSVNYCEPSTSNGFHATSNNRALEKSLALTNVPSLIMPIKEEFSDNSCVKMPDCNIPPPPYPTPSTSTAYHIPFPNYIPTPVASTSTQDATNSWMNSMFYPSASYNNNYHEFLEQIDNVYQKRSQALSDLVSLKQEVQETEEPQEQ